MAKLKAAARVQRVPYMEDGPESLSHKQPGLKRIEVYMGPTGALDQRVLDTRFLTTVDISTKGGRDRWRDFEAAMTDMGVDCLHLTGKVNTAKSAAKITGITPSPDLASDEGRLAVGALVTSTERALNQEGVSTVGIRTNSKPLAGFLEDELGYSVEKATAAYTDLTKKLPRFGTKLRRRRRGTTGELDFKAEVRRLGEEGTPYMTFVGDVTGSSVKFRAIVRADKSTDVDEPTFREVMKSLETTLKKGKAGTIRFHDDGVRDVIKGFPKKDRLARVGSGETSRTVAGFLNDELGYRVTVTGKPEMVKDLTKRETKPELPRLLEAGLIAQKK